MNSSPNLEELFSTALDLPVAEREKFLRENCHDNAALFEEVNQLLIDYEQAKSLEFLSLSALEIEAEHLAKIEDKDSRIGQTIGHYEVLKKIGAGGMGAIYLASRNDGQFEKKVALKLIKRGMDSEAILQRFLLERQILANLEHPFIARLLDAGMTDDGLPYFVMEFIEGKPITEFCQAHELSINEQLELFLLVCSAVSYAHQNLIVHRDLKPSNILVTNDGKPKLLDFGIAKLLNSNDSANVTKTDFQILTPAYASPEQLRGEPITTASDTYALGVVLYELFTQSPPYQVAGKNIGEMIRIICETEPPRPSSVSPKSKVQSPKSESRTINNNGQETNDDKLKTKPKSKIQNPKLKGDLDNIVLKALQKDSLRRYSSVEKFAEDIRRHLVGLPITARPDTFFYRTSKFIQRNTLAIGALSLIFLLLIGGIATTLWQARQAQLARERAERRAENLRRISTSFSVELHNEILNLPGSLHARQLLLTRAVEQLDALASESEDNPTLQDELAQGYYNLGLLPNHDLAQTEQNFQKCVALYTKLLQTEPRNLHFNQQLVKGFTELANVEKVRGKSLESLEFLEKSSVILESFLTAESSDFETENLLFEVESDKSAILSLLGRANESLETSRHALAIGEKLKSLDKNSDDFEQLLYVSRYNICKNLIYLGDYQTALDQLRSDLTIWTEHQKKYPTDTRYNYELWAYQRSLNVVLERIGDKQSATEALQTSLNLMENLRQSSPDDVGYQRNTSFTNLAFGQFWMRQNDAKKALPYFQRALELSEKIYAADAEKGETIADLARIYSSLGNSQCLIGNGEEGLKNLRKSLAFYEKVLTKDPDNAFLQRDYAETLAWLGEILAKTENVENHTESKEFYSKSLEIWHNLQTKHLISAADLQKPDEVSHKFAKLNTGYAK